MSEVKRYGSAVFDSGLIEMASGDYVTYSDYQKLVAENATMREAIDETIGWQESVDASNTESVRLLVALQTPNTDSAIAEIESVGAEKMFNLVELAVRNFCNPQVARLVLEELAIFANLRAGRKG